jgi:hypothetical protein
LTNYLIRERASTQNPDKFAVIAVGPLLYPLVCSLSTISPGHRAEGNPLLPSSLMKPYRLNITVETGEKNEPTSEHARHFRLDDTFELE